MTGEILYPYFKQSFMNPLRDYIKTLSAFGVVIVAYSNPPGTSPIFFLYFINFSILF